MKPLGELVFIKPIEYDTLKTNLVVPQNLVDRKQFGILVGKGEDVIFKINEGDTVMWLDNRGEPITIDGEEHLIMNYKELKGVAKKSNEAN